MYCPDKELKSWKELSTAVGDDVALFLWNRNRGRGLDLTPNGVPSKLFNDLLNMTDGNRIEAFKLKAGFYTDNFIKTNNWIETGAEPSINNLISSTSNVIGIEISSNSKGIGAALTNPTELARKKGNIVDSYPVEYNGIVYEDSEEAYKDLKDESETKTKPTIENSKNYALMVNIIKAKLEQHPRLVAKVKSLGGSNWILASTHQPTSKNSVWETNGKNWFIKALNEAYKTVSGITKLKMSDFINHSGGAYGADTYWDLVGRTFGVIQHVHYKTLDLPKVSKQLRQKGVISKVLTNTQLEESYDQLEKTFNREFERTDNNDLKARNYYQVKNASSIFAVAFLDGSKAVKGGTNAAVQMAIDLNKPVYVYDVASESWYKWDGTKFITTTTPILTKNFAGIGTRDVEDYEVFDEKTNKYVKREGYVGIEKENAIKNAIKEVYQNTQNNLNNIENIGVLEKIAKSEPTTSVETNETIYSKLGDKTQSENVVIKSWGELKDATKAVTKNGIVATRITGDGKDFNFGNPFASDKDILSKNASLIPTNSIKESVERYINWILTGDIGDAINLIETPEDFEKRTGRRMLMWELNKINALPQELDERRDWILEQLKSGELKGKPIFYYKELGEPSHATALDYLINKYNWETQSSTSVNEFDLADKLTPIEQNFADGTGGRAMQPQFKGKSTMDLIISGDRTRTTRAKTDIQRMAKDYSLSKISDLVGKVIRMTDKTGRQVYTRITKVAPFTQEYQDATWQKEGWVKSVTDKHVGDYPYAIEFEVVRTTTQPSTSVEKQIQDRQIKVDQFNLLVKSDGTMFYDNGKEVTNQTIKNKANIRKELQDGTLKVSTYNNSNYFVLSDNRVVSSGKTTLGKESVTDPKIKEMILDKAVKYKKDC